MSDYTISETMADIRYEIDERKIYNDIRSETTLATTEDVLDPDDSDYSYYKFTSYMYVEPGQTSTRKVYIYGCGTPLDCKILTHYAYHVGLLSPTGTTGPYMDYQINITTYGDSISYVTVEASNTGSNTCIVKYTIGCRHLTSEDATHEEPPSNMLSVRAVDSGSISKYGRRVMNLTWTEGTEEDQMQSLVDDYLEKYKEPVGRFYVTILGDTDEKRTQIFTRELSDLITIVCSRLSISTGVDCYINSIKIRDTVNGVPQCEWALEIQRAREALSLFVLGTSELDGANILAA